MKTFSQGIDFTTSLAEQCFLNEYIFYVEEDALEAINKIKLDYSNRDISEFQITLLACYSSIFSLTGKIPSLINSFNLNQNLIRTIIF